MELKVGMKAIIVNSKHHADYNFQMCEIKEIEKSHNGKIFVELHSNNLTTNFWINRNEIIPLIYENLEDLKNVTVEDISKLFTEYKVYYDVICKVAEDISHESDEKEKKYKRQIEDRKYQVEELKNYIESLKSDLAEAQDNKIQLPHEPIKVAEMLIDATETKVNCMTEKEYDKSVYEKWQLEQIAMHLLVYCGKFEDWKI